MQHSKGISNADRPVLSSLGTGDTENAAPLEAEDPDLVSLRHDASEVHDKGVRNVIGSFDNVKITPNQDLRVTRHGTIAWTTETAGTLLDTAERTSRDPQRIVTTNTPK